MVTQTQRTRDLARAALLRERILGALRAAPAPMAIGEMYTMSGIVELYHKSLLPSKVGAQLRALAKSKDVLKVEYGKYAFNRDKAQPAAPQPVQQGTQLQHLQLEVSKAEGTVSFTLNGVRITVKVL